MVTLSVEVTSKSTLHVCNICTPAVSASLHRCVCKHKQVRISYGPRNPSNPDNSQSLRLSCALHNIKEGHGRRETACVRGIVIGGENIDWQLPSRVQTVCELLGVKKTTVYKYRKQKYIKYVQPKRQRRSDALARQPWWPQASALLDTFWELNCDKSPNADDPAEKHNFSCANNHRYDPVPDNPGKMHQVCVGM